MVGGAGGAVKMRDRVRGGAPARRRPRVRAPTGGLRGLCDCPRTPARWAAHVRTESERLTADAPQPSSRGLRGVGARTGVERGRRGQYVITELAGVKPCQPANEPPGLVS
ncbi:hypothetical protein SAMN05216499_121103 [Actinacidiphila paucisporea]|uniref:Uncharacterized protein n=1 Tax=Actinacidiphila paucisporea TaxID=310782 RepID=A0A1M7P794_9ACTN|nr:hypothetical protein SAMN05216499_121103 [Actinacidiphila paucisporea]